MKNKYKDLIKAVLFPFVINLLIMAVLLLDANNTISELVIFLFAILIHVVSGSLFSVIKGDVVKPLQYNIVSMVAHTVFTVVIHVILDSIYKGFVLLTFLFVEKISLFSYLILIIADSIVCLIRKKKH